MVAWVIMISNTNIRICISLVIINLLVFRLVITLNVPLHKQKQTQITNIASETVTKIQLSQIIVISYKLDCKTQDENLRQGVLFIMIKIIAG